jgi:glycosyltransferase involved in cell wall biosynthesis
MNSPRITIVVPSFNQGIYLEETLRSVISQSYENLELIVVDGGSSDNSIDIIKKYEQHIQWWVSEKDKGQSDALNKGLQGATGEIINWLCSDDLLQPGSLQQVADIFSLQPDDVGLIHGGTTLFMDKKIIRNDWGVADPSAERYFAGIAFSQPSAFFRKKYFDHVGGLLNETLHYGMDYELYSRLACVCRFTAVKNIFSAYRLHQNSKSIAQESRFAIDWNKTFINLCKNLGWNELLGELRKTTVIEHEQMEYYQPFVFHPSASLINGVDKRKIIFYHCCILLKSFYHTGQRDKARLLLKYLQGNYLSAWLQSEKHIPQIISRLKIPESMLSLMIELKKSVKALTGR